MDGAFDLAPFSFLVSSNHPQLTGLIQFRPIFHLRSAPTLEASVVMPLLFRRLIAFL
jgi:hypothetical protein